jgi:hypothetical protein
MQEMYFTTDYNIYSHSEIVHIVRVPSGITTLLISE